MTTHSHNDARLTIGCPACIGRVKADQLAETIRRMDVDDLVELMAENDGKPKGELAVAELLRRYPVGNGFVEVAS
jgi:hypothetical protein